MISSFCSHRLSKNRILFFIFFSLLLITNKSVAQYDTLWTKVYGGADNDFGYSVQQTTDGGFIAVGGTQSFGAGNHDVYLVKTDSNGTQLWQKTFGGSGGDDGLSVKQTTDGGFIIVGGTTLFSTAGDVYLIKTDGNGNLQWYQVFGGASSDNGYSILQTGDGGYIIAGQTYSFGAGYSDAYLIKTDVGGNMQWYNTYGGTSTEYAISIQQTTDGGYIMTGTGYSFGAGLTDVYLIKVNASGTQQWLKTFGGTNYEAGNSVKQTSDGGYIVAGYTQSFGVGDNDVYLIKTDSDGNEQWTKTFGGSNYDQGQSIQITSDGGFLIAGRTRSFGSGNLDVYLVKTDSDGAQEWQKTIGGTSFDYAEDIEKTSGGGYIITGSTTDNVHFTREMYLIKLGFSQLLINATGGSNGSITPSGTVAVTPGSSQAFVITPNPGYHIDSVKVDGIKVDSTTSYTFSNVTTNHTITAFFSINQYALSVSADYGVVMKIPNQETYNHGTVVQVSQTPGVRYLFTGWSGDASGTDNPLSVTMDGDKSIEANYIVDPVYQVLYRTAKMEDWATSADAKGKYVSIKRKTDKVFFKFNLVADSVRPLMLDFGMLVNASVTRGKSKLDTLAVVTNGKKLTDSLFTVSAGETLQVDGIGMKGKKIAVKYQWGKKKAVTLKADSLFKLNRVGLPLPNLHNVGEELFPVKKIQNGYYSKLNPLVIGIPQGLKKGNSVVHLKYGDIQKSLVKIVRKNPVLHSDTLSARCLDSLDGKKKKAMLSQQKGLPPDKQNNKLFAEALTLKLNITASLTEKFPSGLGEMTYDNPDDEANSFNGELVTTISTLADSMLSCLPLSSKPTATLEEIYSAMRNINIAFADSPYTVDTLSFGTKTRLNGLKQLFDVPYLRPTPGVSPKILFAENVIVENVPDEFALYQNYPNPFNPSTNFGFRIVNFGLVTLKIYNMLGQEVSSRLNNEEMEEGEYEFSFDAINLPSGVYFYRINVEGEEGMIKYTDVKRMTLIK